MDASHVDGAIKSNDRFEQEIELKIVNVVASTNLAENLDLTSIKKIDQYMVYLSEKFPGLLCRLNHPRVSILLFNSGKIVCTGAKSEKMAITAIKKVTRYLINNNIIKQGKSEIKIQNILASGSIHGKIDLETAADIMENVMYEPEQFPGLVYRMSDPKVVMLLFTTGKLMCTGAKHKDMVNEAFRQIHETLHDYGLIY